MKNFTTMQNLREALVDLMDKRDLSQAEVGQKAGVRQSAISLFINGKRSLNGDSTLKIQNFILAETTTTTPNTTQP